jgi:hypothetical protein
MPPTVDDIHTIDQLHAYVHAVLCEKENLLAEMFVTQKTTLNRGGRCCGLQFHLQGPRCVKLGAVWAAEQNTVFFYDTRGTRYLKVRLANRLTGDAVAA